MHRLSAATRALALLFAIVLVFAPVCPAQHCARACCPMQSDNCASVLDQSLACLEASTPSAPAPSDAHNFALIVEHTPALPNALLGTSHGPLRTLLFLRHPSAPPPPLRI